MIKSIVNTFLPWLIYFSLTKWINLSASASAVIVILISILFYRKALFQYWYVLSWANIGLFSLIIINAYIFRSGIINSNIAAISYSLFFVIGLLSILFKSPFTLQYAKREVDHSKWEHPMFLKINYTLTIFWTMVFLFNFAINLTPKVIFYKWNLYMVSYIVTLLGIIFTIEFPKIYRQTHKKALE